MVIINRNIEFLETILGKDWGRLTGPASPEFSCKVPTLGNVRRRDSVVSHTELVVSHRRARRL